MVDAEQKSCSTLIDTKLLIVCVENKSIRTLVGIVVRLIYDYPKHLTELW